MSSFIVLQQRVQARLIDVPNAVLTEVPQLINDAINYLQQIHNFNVMKSEITYFTKPAPTSAPGNLTPHILGQIPQAAPAQLAWKEPRENPYYVLQIGDTRELDWAPAGNRLYTYRQWAPFDPFSKGPPRMLLISPGNDDPLNPDLLGIDMNVECYPYSDSLSDWTTAPVGEYRVHLPYWGYLPNLSANSDTNWFTENATEYILAHATALGFEMDWDEERSMFWHAKAFGKAFDESNFNTLGGFARVALNLDRSITYAPGRVLVPRRDVFAPRDQWRT